MENEQPTKEQIVNEIIQKLKEYLKFKSLDGKLERQEYRKNLELLLKEYNNY